MKNTLPIVSQDGSPQEATSCASLLKVLADETRLAVMELLLEGPRHVGEIAERLQVEQTLLSHHLRVLRDAGLVVSERNGKQVEYRVTSEVRGRRKGNAIDLGCCKISFE